MNRVIKSTLSLSLFVLLAVVTADAQDIHVYSSGTSPYVGAAGLQQALSNAADPGTVYVHSGTYDLGATATSFLTITKGLSLVGVDDGTGKPLIKGARPSGSPGLVLVNAPQKAVLLENLTFSFSGNRAVGSNDTAIAVVGSNSFTLRNCTLTGAYFDGTNNTGLASALSIAGPARSELDPASPAYASRLNVKGEVVIQNSQLTSWINTIGIGFFGPVSLDKIEVSNCTLTALGSTQLGDWARGNFGVLITQYPFYMTDANRSSLVEATHAGTTTTVTNNVITTPNTIWLLYLKGLQKLEKNRLNSFGAWYSAGKYYQAPIAAFGYPHEVADPATYSEALISDNVIELRVPAFPIIPSITFAPPQTLSNTSPPVGIWLGVGSRLFYNSTIAGYYAKATITGNIVSSNPFAPTPTLNFPDYGLSLAGKTKDSFIAGNNYAGGTLKDPIDGQVKPFNPFIAKIAQVNVGVEAHDNRLLNNAFGPAGVTGVLCYGHDNRFENNHFFGNYVGWEPGNGPGIFWLTSTSHGNGIVANKLNQPAYGFDNCRQIYDETNTGMTEYRGLNLILGFNNRELLARWGQSLIQYDGLNLIPSLYRCRTRSADFIQQMQAVRAELEAR